MSNLLSSLINPDYSLVDSASQEKLMSQILSRSPQKAPPMLDLTPSAPTVRPRTQDTEWQKKIQANKEKKSIQGALDEIVKTRDELGIPYLSLTQRTQIFSKHGVPSQVSNGFNAAIDRKVAEAEKTRSYMNDPSQSVMRTLPDGSTSTTYESKQNVIDNPIVRQPSRPAPTMREENGKILRWDGKNSWVDTGRRKETKGMFDTRKQQIDFNRQLKKDYKESLPFGEESTPQGEAKYRAGLFGDNFVEVEGKGRKTGQFMYQDRSTGQMYDQYLNPMQPTKSNKPAKTTETTATNVGETTKRIKESLKLKKTAPVENEHMKLFDPMNDEDNIPFIDVEGVKDGGKAIFKAVKKTGDLVGSVKQYLIDTNQKVGDAIFNGIVKAIKAAVASQKEARKESLGF